MARPGLTILVAIAVLGACAGGGAAKRSYTPRTEVVVKGGAKRPAQADFRARPEESTRTGSGGDAR